MTMLIKTIGHLIYALSYECQKKVKMIIYLPQGHISVGIYQAICLLLLFITVKCVQTFLSLKNVYRRNKLKDCLTVKMGNFAKL
jgi:hypothetical protein